MKIQRETAQNCPHGKKRLWCRKCSPPTHEEHVADYREQYPRQGVK